MILKINNKEFDFFNNVNVQMTFDGIASSFSFDAVFNPEDEEHKKLFRPLRYSKIEIEHNGETLITGRKIGSGFKSAAKKTTSTINGYSLTGVLNDCTIPLSVYPLQADGLTLKEVAEKLLKPFDIAVVIDSAVKDAANAVLETTEAKATGSVASYLTTLAAQKSIIVSHTSRGALLLTEAKPNRRPVGDLSNAIEKTLSANGQQLHSYIAVLKDATITGGNAGEEELDNPLIDSFRPKVAEQKSGTDVDTELVAKQIRAAELKAITLTIKLDSWMLGDKVLRPNIIVSVHDHEIYLYNKTNWFVQSVTLLGNEKEQTAVLKCVLPEVYTLKTPSNPF